MTNADQNVQAAYRQARKYWAILAASLLNYVVLAALVNIVETPFHGFVELSSMQRQLIRALFIAVSISVIPVTSWIVNQPRSISSQPDIVTRTVIAMALSGSPGIMGLAFYLMTARLPEFIGGLALSAILSAYYFPRSGGPTDVEP